MAMYHVLATNGHTQIGGSLFDERLVDYCLEKTNENMWSMEDMVTLKQKCEEAKKALSQLDEVEIDFKEKMITINRKEYNEIMSPFIDFTMMCVKNALEDADIEKEEIDRIVLVGGSTYMPLISDTLERFFEKKVNREINPMEAGTYITKHFSLKFIFKCN